MAIFLLPLILSPILAIAQTVPQTASPPDIVSQYSLTTSTSIPFPTATTTNDDTQSFIKDNWSLSKGRIQNGRENLDFVDDPFPDSPTPASWDSSAPKGPVLRVTYPEGAFGSADSGAQFYSLWNTTDGSQFHSMLVTYEVALDANFTFVKGGKLPGLRGGPQPDGCSGGNAANGTNCFSSRLMWRTGGAGEVYGYFPNDDSKAICSQSSVICNSDGFGTSLSRGNFHFQAAHWHRVTMLVRLNDPLKSANGQITIYFNGALAANYEDIQYRSSDVINIGGLYFSTFFGGDDSSWAPSGTTHAYFRNFELWGAAAASNLTTSPAQLSATPLSSPAQWLFGIVAAIGGSFIGMIL
ncbi:hypothetical protein BXZ70DRAFT_22766 [Cristinia sonorae]|uniref:Polysaccharide lyase 14 domain-containing protein n=1 Tax=Cristinia sonorae TaxID=1940300 RepID=A0A8K0XW89_9AGAR|nr:hypothetical protein BXZ70DRAFT_22766 [Cristinia sonorae]